MLSFAAGAAAAPGGLDPTFAIAGVGRTDIGMIDTPSDLTVQTDGSIIAAGSVDQAGTRNVFVARYRPDGSPDSAFGNAGLVVPSRYHQVAPRLAVQPDGKIIVATRGESADGPVFLYRFGADGSLDAAFGNGGTAVISPPTGVSIAGVAGVDIAAGAKIIVALRATPPTGGASVAFARFNADGTPDTAFGSGGFIEVRRELLWLPLAFVQQPDGKLLVAGYAWAPNRFLLDGFVARFHADGSLDTSFDTDGVALVQQPSTATEFQALAVASDGSIFAGGREFGSFFGQNRWLLAKFTGAGAIDPHFGAAGLAIIDPGPGDDVILDLGLTRGSIYATGSIDRSLGLPVAMFARNGTLDPAFGTDGFAGLPGQFTRGAARLAVQNDGKVVVIGSVQSFTPTFNQDLYLARYEGGAPADTDAPALALPAVVAAEATTPDGTIVDYAASVSAVDAVDGSVPITCEPSSGSSFPIGDTTVACAATDAAGNRSSGSFIVHVKGAAEQLRDLISRVDGLELGRLGSSLHDKLLSVQRFLVDAKARQAAENLAAFVAEVDAQRGKGLSEQQGEALAAAALRIIDVIAA